MPKPAGRRTKAATVSATLPKKWIIKWTDEAAQPTPATTCCPTCNGILELYDDLAELGVAQPVTWADKVQECRTKTLQYMGHFLRCTLQQQHISACLDHVVANPTHVHVVVDYKVRRWCVCFVHLESI